MTAIASTHLRRLWLGFGALLLLVVVSGAAVMSFLGFRWAADEVVSALDQHAIAVARSVERPLVRAISLGIPLAEIPGVPAFLERRLHAAPGIDFIAVVDATGGLLHQVGSEPGGSLDQVLASDALRHDFTETDFHVATDHIHSIAVGTDFVFAVPLLDDGAPAGFVLVGVDRFQITDELATPILWRIVVLGLVALVLVGEFLAFAVHTFCTAPAGRFAHLAQEVAAGRLEKLSARYGDDEFGQCFRALNALIFRIRDDFQRFCAHAEEVSKAVFDAGIAARIGEVRADVDRHFGSGMTAVPIRWAAGDAADIHVPVFLCWTAAALLAAQAGAGSSGTVLIAVLLGLAIGTLLPVTHPKMPSLRHVVAAGNLAGAVGVAAIMSLADGSAAWIGLGLAGFGAGLTARAAGRYVREAALESHRKDTVRSVGLRCLSGILVGSLSGGFLVVEAASLVAALAGILTLLGTAGALRFMVERPGMSRRG